MKRIRGRGRIEKKADGKYRLRVSMGYSPDGRKLEKSKTVYVEGKTEKEKYAMAESEMRRFITELENDRVAGGNIRFSAFVIKWREDYAIGNLEKNTLSWYNNCMPLIIEYFGKTRICDISVKTIEDFLKWVVNVKNKSKQYANTLLKIMKAMLNVAERWQWIHDNPCKKAMPYSIRKNKISVYNSEMLFELLEALDGYPVRQRLYVYLPLFCGLRREEVIALSWANVDLKRKKIYIKEAAVYAGKEFGAYIKATKTESSERVVDLPEFLILIMQDFKKQQYKKRLAMGSAWETNDYIFINEENGKMMMPGSLSYWFRRFIKRHNLPHITYHGLRHTYASLLVKCNVDIARISKSLGHNNVSTTMKIYIHGIKEAERDIAAVIDSKFGNRFNEETNHRIV